jgi:hypothetical protein
MREERKTTTSLKLLLEDLTELYFIAGNIEHDLGLDNNISRCLSMAEDNAIRNLEYLRGRKEKEE